MDPVIVREKLESLRRCISRVEHKRPKSVAALEADADVQDILVLGGLRRVATHSHVRHRGRTRANQRAARTSRSACARRATASGSGTGRRRKRSPVSGSVCISREARPDASASGALEISWSSA
jgi:hypothetical protein